jgi:hypothetical protein
LENLFHARPKKPREHMKQPKKLTRNQKEILVKKGMNPDDYMLHSEDEKEMILYNRKEKRLEAVEK